MKIKLTENVKNFVETLDKESRAKLVITEDAIESDDEAISVKYRAYLFSWAEDRIRQIGDGIREHNKQLRKDHPEYFEN